MSYYLISIVLVGVFAYAVVVFTNHNNVIIHRYLLHYGLCVFIALQHKYRAFVSTGKLSVIELDINSVFSGLFFLSLVVAFALYLLVFLLIIVL